MSQWERVQLPEECNEIALCGGPYNNFAAVERFLSETRTLAYRFCLGDMGGFGPHPDRTLDLIRRSNLRCVQGNYDRAVGLGEPECGCGYLDPRDRHFAQLSFDYTLKHTSEPHRAWLRELPPQILIEWRGKRILLCHGSPFEVSEFVWESETPSAKIEGWLDELGVDGICATHSGLPWLRSLPGGRFWLNVGVLGRPAHEGRRNVYYATLTFPPHGTTPIPRVVPMEYDSAPVILEMRREGLPEEFIQSLEQGIWTTCFHILPPDEKVVKRRH